MKNYGPTVEATRYADSLINPGVKYMVERAYLDGYKAAESPELTEDQVQNSLKILGLNIRQIIKLRDFYRVQTGKDISDNPNLFTHNPNPQARTEEE